MTVSAAASLTEAFREIEIAFEATGSAEIALNLASSGTLEAQIRAGAPVGVFAAASEREPGALHGDGLVEMPTEFARNRLVLVAREDIEPPADLSDLGDERFTRIAIGSPATVPSGRYAEEVLQRTELSAALGGRLVPCDDVRQVLAYLASGEVDAGFVYVTDLAALPQEMPHFVVPDTLHAPIRYMVCVVRSQDDDIAPHVFLRFLISEEGQSILREHGFLPPHPTM